jgi:acylphosphatase
VNDMERRRVLYSGHVQGVGFRYSTVSVARRYPVTGFVQNLPDGRVVVVAEGEATALDRFLSDLNDTMGGYIQNAHTETHAATGEFRGFQLQF